ncbi:MAG: threonylcarbamoyl-AMP synthase [Deltaproteobacteria bacterium RIFOXYD12_FULL_50_9]|nr:MAG: threonylcarbamoyl-AMP synthase [Deltaproteobacteria bacterium RIFOXYD12_FULL_50_9]
MLIEINPDNPQSRLIQQVVGVLKKGGVICYPTDTVYGIGCDIFNQKAVKRIYQIKRRPQQKPFSFICSDLKDVSIYGHISNLAYRIMKKHLPGAYTFIVPAAKIVPKIMTTKQKTVGIRVPDNEICRALVEALGNPILTTSAVTGDAEEAQSEAFAIEERLGRLVDLVIDGGPVYPCPSSIVSLIDDNPVILRIGKGDVSMF